MAILLALVVPSPSAPADTADAACAPTHVEPDLGLACVREDGLYEVWALDGTYVGTTHGPDPAPAVPEDGEAGTQSVGARPPHCVDASANTFYVQVIYARASNDADTYASQLPIIRDLVNRANGLVYDASLATGGRTDLRVKCIGAQVEVANAVLPTPKESADFSSITRDLRNQGFNSGQVKYWVHYKDASACTCAGQGNVHSDDTASVHNSNNGNAGPMFAVTYGLNSVRVMLHELGHTLGAVQWSAPHTSLGWHCTDGRDTMCYRDTGPLGLLLYNDLSCALEVWDCGKDDYFNVSPEPGSYLATHWNLASPFNRYIHYVDASIPEIDLLTCPFQVDLGNASACSFRAQDDSAGVYYDVSWGDGNATRVPSTGTVAPGTTQQASHTYGSAGAKTVTVTATDDGSPPKTSVPAWATIQVIVDNEPPQIFLWHPAPAHVYEGCDLRANNVASSGPGRYLSEGCILADVLDHPEGVASVSAFFDGVALGTKTSGPFRWEFPAGTPRNGVEVTVVALDNGGRSSSVTTTVDVAGSPIGGA